MVAALIAAFCAASILLFCALARVGIVVQACFVLGGLMRAFGVFFLAFALAYSVGHPLIFH